MVDFMLANEYIEGKKAPRGLSNYEPPIGWFASEKYDGYRAQYLPNKQQFVSRQNKPFNAPQWFLSALSCDERLDGELWIGRDQFQEMGVVRKKVPIDDEWIPIQFCVYDLPDYDAPFNQRYAKLLYIVKKLKEQWKQTRANLPKQYKKLPCPIVITKQHKISSKEHMNKLYQNVIQNGGEGIMIKDPESQYEGKRSHYMLKYKPCFDAEGIIVDYKDGANKYKGLLGAFICKPLLNHGTYSTIDNDENHTFAISGMDDDVRNNYKQTHPIGTIVTYEYSGITNSGKPRFARYVRKREDITLKDKVDTSIEKKESIIRIFQAIETHERTNGHAFKAKAYKNAIQSLQTIHDDSELVSQSLLALPGIGSSIYDKIQTICQTGTCSLYESIRNKKNPREDFCKIHGVGVVKAKALEKQGFQTIQDLRKCENIQDHLNDVQIKGLKYYEDINQRIPREEIHEHKQYLQKILSEIPNSDKAELTIAGSYRRGKKDSGDIDILLKTPSVKNNSIYNQFIDRLSKEGYLSEILSRGSKKCMGICKLRKIYRRIDIMFTKPEEYPFAILYFTGSDDFNVSMRKQLLERGLSLNEYSLKDNQTKKKIDHTFSTEKDIFDYLELDYVTPEQR